MKYFIVLPCLLVVAYGLTQEAIDIFKAKMIKLSGECKTEIGATEDDIAPILKHEPPISHNGKCFVACINKKMGFFDESGKISKEGSRAVIEQVKVIDGDLYEKLKVVSEHCLAEVSDAADECETAVNMYVCVKKEREAAGIQIDHLSQ